MKILIDVRKLLHYEEVYLEEDHKYTFEPFHLGAEEVKFISPVHLHAGLTRIKSGILLDGHIDTVVEVTCSRCLERTELPLDVDIHEVFSIPGMEETFDGFDTVFTIGADEKIDIEPALNENIIVNIPVKPLCSENCLGICPVCGKNRNLEKCDCEEEKVDPRLEVLKKLKDSL